MLMWSVPVASRIELTAWCFGSVSVSTLLAGDQVDPAASVSPTDLTAAVEATGFTATCIASTTTEEPTLEQDGVNAVWAIASALGE